MRRRKLDAGSYAGFNVLWSGYGFDGEPNVNRARLSQGDGALNISAHPAGDDRDIIVLDSEVIIVWLGRVM
jgi:hypothetical protein